MMASINRLYSNRPHSQLPDINLTKFYPVVESFKAHFPP